MKVQLLGTGRARQWIATAPRRFAAAVGRGLKRGATIVQSAARKMVYAGHPDHLVGRSGRLRQGIVQLVHETYAEVGTNVVYGPAHEFGATIVPRNSKYLAIPVGDLRGSPRDHELNWTPGADGGILRDDAGEAQYVLKSSVTIPPRPFLTPAFEQSGPKVREAMRKEMERELP